MNQLQLFAQQKQYEFAYIENKRGNQIMTNFVELFVLSEQNESIKLVNKFYELFHQYRDDICRFSELVMSLKYMYWYHYYMRHNATQEYIYEWHESLTSIYNGFYTQCIEEAYQTLGSETCNKIFKSL